MITRVKDVLEDRCLACSLRSKSTTFSRKGGKKLLFHLLRGETYQETGEKSDRKCLAGGHGIASICNRHRGSVWLLTGTAAVFLLLLCSW